MPPRLSFDTASMGRAALNALCGMSQSLESLDLSGTSLEDEDLVHLKGLNRLTALYLNCQLARSDISNLGLAELAQLPSLRRLELTTNCSISALGE